MNKVLIKIKSKKELLKDGYKISHGYIEKFNFSLPLDYLNKVFSAEVRDDYFKFTINRNHHIHESQVKVLRGKLVETLYDYSKE